MHEYRVWTTVPSLHFANEASWEPFIDALERSHPELGPVISWEGDPAEDSDSAVVVVSTSADDEAAAAQIAAAAMTDALHEAGLGDHYPATYEIERAEDDPRGVAA